MLHLHRFNTFVKTIHSLNKNQSLFALILMKYYLETKKLKSLSTRSSSISLHYILLQKLQSFDGIKIISTSHIAFVFWRAIPSQFLISYTTSLRSLMVMLIEMEQSWKFYWSANTRILNQQSTFLFKLFFADYIIFFPGYWMGNLYSFNDSVTKLWLTCRNE